MDNRKTPNFAYGNFATQKDLICVKEFAYGSPKFLVHLSTLRYIPKTFLNPNIKLNSDFCLPTL